jgi:hypothetical protein
MVPPATIDDLHPRGMRAVYVRTQTFYHLSYSSGCLYDVHVALESLYDVHVALESLYDVHVALECTYIHTCCSRMSC